MKIIKGMGKLLPRLAGYLAALWRQRQRRNQWMVRRYTSAMLALIGTLVCLAVAVYALFVNPCLGVANDSIGNQKMSEYGLSYREADRGEDPARFSSNEYFTRSYETARTGDPIHSSQNLFVRAAMALDAVVTSDGLFDVRFLALVYLALYLPAVYLVLKAGLERVRYFSEAVAVTALGVLIFADISYLPPVLSAADGRRGVRKNVQGLQPLRRRPCQRTHCGRPGIRGLRADRLTGRVKEKPPYTKPERPCGMLRLS